mgnify:CR=1 FL=1
MAKAQGIEPQLAVLETAVLPLDYALIDTLVALPTRGYLTK